MILKRTLLLISTISCLLFIASCSLPRYQDVQPKYSGAKSEIVKFPRILHLKPVFPNRPFDEMVCDNTVGTIWSPEESKRIGLTQNYADTLAKNAPQLALLASLPTNLAVGLSASGQSGGFNISSRIMVPYGRLITSNLSELLAETSPESVVCLTQVCVEERLRIVPGSRVVSVQFTVFKVAEQKTNTLSLAVEAIASFDANGQQRFVKIKQGVENRSITTEGLFHSDAIRAMNKISNEVTSAAARDINAASTGG